MKFYNNDERLPINDSLVAKIMDYIKTSNKDFFNIHSAQDGLLIENSPCWVWHGPKTGNGYGNVHWSYGKRLNKNLHVRRVLYALHKVSLNPGAHLMDLCQNKQCVNPDHMVVSGSDLYSIRIKEIK